MGWGVWGSSEIPDFKNGVMGKKKRLRTVACPVHFSTQAGKKTKFEVIFGP